MPTETRTFVGETSTTAFDEFRGLRQRYTGVVQEDGCVLVSAVGAPVTKGEFEKWFRK